MDGVMVVGGGGGPRGKSKNAMDQIRNEEKQHSLCQTNTVILVLCICCSRLAVGECVKWDGQRWEADGRESTVF